MELEQIAREVVDCGFLVHASLGPGLLALVYEAVFASQTSRRGLRAARHVAVPIRYDGQTFDEGFRAFLLVEDQLLVELKSVEKLAPVHLKQVPDVSALAQLPARSAHQFRCTHL